MAEGEKGSTLTVAVASGVFLIGTLVGGNKLLLPRVFTTFEEKEPDPQRPGQYQKDPETGQDLLVPKIRMQPLPGTPAFVVLKGDGFTYPVPEEDIFIYRLYRKVTTPPSSEDEARRVSLN